MTKALVRAVMTEDQLSFARDVVCSSRKVITDRTAILSAFTRALTTRGVFGASHLLESAAYCGWKTLGPIFLHANPADREFLDALEASEVSRDAFEANPSWGAHRTAAEWRVSPWAIRAAMRRLCWMPMGTEDRRKEPTVRIDSSDVAVKLRSGWLTEEVAASYGLTYRELARLTAPHRVRQWANTVSTRHNAWLSGLSEAGTLAEYARREGISPACAFQRAKAVGWRSS